MYAKQKNTFEKQKRTPINKVPKPKVNANKKITLKKKRMLDKKRTLNKIEC